MGVSAGRSLAAPVLAAPGLGLSPQGLSVPDDSESEVPGVLGKKHPSSVSAMGRVLLH